MIKKIYKFTAKKISYVLVLSSMIIGLVGCGDKVDKDVKETSTVKITTKATEKETTSDEKITTTQEQTQESTQEPTPEPTPEPTEAPPQAPTPAPTPAPTQAPTPAPTPAPTEAPTEPSTQPQTQASSGLEEKARIAFNTYRDWINEELTYVNQVRAEAGKAPLVLDEQMSIAACARCVEMIENKYFAHTRPDGRSCFTILDEYNISRTTSGENIAWGYSSPSAVVEGWKNSPGHYANMINERYTRIGIGVAYGDGEGQGFHWTQLFCN